MAELVQNTYANSLFEVALENSKEEEVSSQLAELQDIFAQNSEYLKILSAPVVAREVKQQLVGEAFEGRVSFIVLNFLRLLVDNGRFDLINAIILEYKSIYDEHRGILEVTAITAAPLSDKLYEKLVAKLNLSTGKKVRLKTFVDEKILGGIKLSYNNTEVDATVKSKLDEMKLAIKQQVL